MKVLKNLLNTYQPWERIEMNEQDTVAQTEAKTRDSNEGLSLQHTCRLCTNEEDYKILPNRIEIFSCQSIETLLNFYSRPAQNAN